MKIQRIDILKYIDIIVYDKTKINGDKMDNKAVMSYLNEILIHLMEITREASISAEQIDCLNEAFDLIDRVLRDIEMQNLFK